MIQQPVIEHALEDAIELHSPAGSYYSKESDERLIEQYRAVLLALKARVK